MVFWGNKSKTHFFGVGRGTFSGFVVESQNVTVSRFSIGETASIRAQNRCCSQLWRHVSRSLNPPRRFGSGDGTSIGSCSRNCRVAVHEWKGEDDGIGFRRNDLDGDVIMIDSEMR